MVELIENPLFAVGFIMLVAGLILDNIIIDVLFVATADVLFDFVADVIDVLMVVLCSADVVCIVFIGTADDGVVLVVISAFRYVCIGAVSGAIAVAVGNMDVGEIFV